MSNIIKMICIIIHLIIKFIINTTLSLEVRTIEGFVLEEFRLSKKTLQRCTIVPTQTPRMNLHTYARIRVASWFHPFLNVALISTNGLWWISFSSWFRL
jgi:hypothetical protein